MRLTSGGFIILKAVTYRVPITLGLAQHWTQWTKNSGFLSPGSCRQSWATSQLQLLTHSQSAWSRKIIRISLPRSSHTAFTYSVIWKEFCPPPILTLLCSVLKDMVLNLWREALEIMIKLCVQTEHRAQGRFSCCAGHVYSRQGRTKATSNAVTIYLHRPHD